MIIKELDPNENTNYSYEKQKECIKKFSNEYSQIFLYKTIKRFLPEMELSQYDEELIKARLYALAKQRERNFVSIFEEINKKFNVENLSKELFEAREKNLILNKGESENSSGDQANGNLEGTMTKVYINYLKNQIEEMKKNN